MPLKPLFERFGREMACQKDSPSLPATGLFQHMAPLEGVTGRFFVIELDSKTRRLHSQLTTALHQFISTEETRQLLALFVDLADIDKAMYAALAFRRQPGFQQIQLHALFQFIQRRFLFQQAKCGGQDFIA